MPEIRPALFRFGGMGRDGHQAEQAQAGFFADTPCQGFGLLGQDAGFLGFPADVDLQEDLLREN